MQVVEIYHSFNLYLLVIIALILALIVEVLTALLRLTCRTFAEANFQLQFAFIDTSGHAIRVIVELRFMNAIV